MIFISKSRYVSVSLILFGFVALTVLLWSIVHTDSNHVSEGRLIAEEYAVSYFITREARLYSVEEAFYDKKVDRYIVRLKDNEENITKTITIGVTNGEISSYDLGDGAGEFNLIGQPTITEEIPGQINYEYHP